MSPEIALRAEIEQAKTATGVSHSLVRATVSGLVSTEVAPKPAWIPVPLNATIKRPVKTPRHDCGCQSGSTGLLQ